MGKFSCGKCNFSCNKEHNYREHIRQKHVIQSKQIDKLEFDNKDEFKCVLSVGTRCHTEIYLKKFSGPFDGLYMSSVNDIIYLMNNRINIDDLIYTEDDDKFSILNNQYGFRSIHTKLDNTFMNNNNSVNNLYDYSTFPHHNLKNTKVQKHFHRCFDRLDIIKKQQIRTLFCLFIHPKYDGYVNVSISDVETLSNYLNEMFNCHLLAIYFSKNQNKQPYHIVKKTENYTIFNINEFRWNFDKIDIELREIFKMFNVNENNLLKYNYFSV